LHLVQMLRNDNAMPHEMILHSESAMALPSDQTVFGSRRRGAREAFDHRLASLFDVNPALNLGIEATRERIVSHGN
jgi:hypothetical protein